MHNDDDKPPAPPLRLTSNRGEFLPSLPVDMRPLPREPEEKKHHKEKKSKKSKEFSSFADDYLFRIKCS